MPIYDYRCDECGHRFSAVQSFNDAPLDKCPNCGKKPRRLIAAPAIVFKGGGWYKTDSRGAAPKDGDAPASSDKSDKDKKESAKADAKTDAKTDAKADTKSDSKPAGDSSPKTEAKS